MILVDTSAYFAVFDRSDKNHVKAVNFLKNNTLPLVTTNLIVIETVNLVNARLGHQQAISIGNKLFDRNVTTVLNISSDDEKKAWHIFQRYIDKDFSLTDCTSFAVMERLRIKKAFAYDVHFVQYGRFSIIS